MALRQLDKAEWRPFFDHLSKTLDGSQAEIEVTSLALVTHVQALWLPFLGITYDAKDDLVEVALEGLDHMIRQPRTIQIEDGNGLLASVEIVDGDGVRQAVKLREPLLLAPPRA